MVNIWKDYPQKPLPDLLEFIVDNRGKTVPTVSQEEACEIVLIATNCIRNENLYPVYEKVRYISRDTYENWFRAHPQSGDIIFVNKGTPGRVCFCPEHIDFCIAQDMMAFRADSSQLYNKYLLALLRSRELQEQIRITSVGDTIPHFKKEFLKELAIPLPPLSIQHIIGDYYFTLSEKIELNNRINANLEQQAQAIFQSWFVDFEPFEEDFIESPIGSLIPKSLQMIQISDIPHDLETGKRPKGGAVSEGVPSVGAENVKKLGEFNPSSAKYIPFEFASKMKKGEIKGYELLLYKDGGKPGTFIPHFSMFGEGFPYSYFYINEHVFKLDFYNRGFNEFMYFYLQTDYPYNWLANNGGKAAVPGINQQDINAIWCYSPNHPKVKEFCKWVEPTFTTILTNCAQNMNLAALRDALLPKLMSGEIDVSAVNI